MRRDYPNLDIYARVPTLEDEAELQIKGIRHAGTTFIESTLFRGIALLKDMGVAEDHAATLVEILRKDDYKAIRQSLMSADKSGA